MRASAGGGKIEGVRNAVIKAFRSFVYGRDPWDRFKDIPVPDLDFQPGRVIVKRTDAPSLVYAITETDVSSDDIQDDDWKPIAQVASCADLYHPDSDMNAEHLCHLVDTKEQAPSCPDNTNPVLVTRPEFRNTYRELKNSLNVCGLCPAGTGGDGNGCTACPAGTVSTIGGPCEECPPGTYSQSGSSTCFPCPMGTYSDAHGSGTCKECPLDSFAWIPGSTVCLRCVRGVPLECLGGDCGPEPSSPASMVVSTTEFASCGLTSQIGYEFKTYTKCSSWKDAAPALQFAFDVGGDCAIQISPITDPSCADPTDSRAAPDSPDYDPKVHPYGAVQIRGYYQTPTQIRSLFDTKSGVTKSVMFSITPLEHDRLTWKLFAATTDPVEAENPFVKTYPGAQQISPAVCTTTLSVTGGEIAGVHDPDDSCPDGTYTDGDEICPKCPVGNTCSNGHIYECPFNTYNSLYGSSSPCAVCPPDGDYTAYSASQHCDVAKAPLQQECNKNTARSYQYDRAAQKCAHCPAGTWRDYDDTTTFKCKHCPKGTYSKEGDRTCTPCPLGEVGPSEGLGSRWAFTGRHCVTCPAGSMALKAGQAGTGVAPRSGSTFCSPCPPGTYLPGLDQSCESCPEGTYRTGDATPENNVCKPIPSGYRLAAEGGHVDIELCPEGQVSYYDQAGRRVPRGRETQCLACSALDREEGLQSRQAKWAHTYAPRKGMSQCIPCPAGTAPVTARGATPSCEPCPNGQFREADTVSATCRACGAGREVGPSDKAACTQCRPGFAMTAQRAALGTAESNNCAECTRNAYRPTLGAISCKPCPCGTQTMSGGNVECTLCPKGYWNSQDGATCMPARPGEYVDSTGSCKSSHCPKGTFNDQWGQQTCTPCAPGQFSNTLGAQSCKTCPPGTFSSGGASACVPCRPGFFSPAGAAACSPCPAGQVAPQPRSTRCRHCKKGFQCPTPAMTRDGPCPKGTFSRKEGMRVCDPCPINTFSSGGGSAHEPRAVAACQYCPRGMDTRGLVGQSSCQPSSRRHHRLHL